MLNQPNAQAAEKRAGRSSDVTKSKRLSGRSCTTSILSLYAASMTISAAEITSIRSLDLRHCTSPEKNVRESMSGFLKQATSTIAQIPPTFHRVCGGRPQNS